VSVDV